jgi:hypothetical protein
MLKSIGLTPVLASILWGAQGCKRSRPKHVLEDPDLSPEADIVEAYEPKNYLDGNLCNNCI